MNPIEKLAVFHEGYDEANGFLSSARVLQRLIIPIELFHNLEEEISVGREVQDGYKQDIERVHNRMLFDSYNEALDNFRPYGLKGSPFPWRPNAGRLKSVMFMTDNLPEILERAQERVADWAIFICGFMPDKDDSMLGEIIIEEDYLNQIKEDRLIKMLNCEVIIWLL